MSNLESEWLNQAQRGDPEAFSRLIEMYQGPVYNLCYRMLGEANDAEDAAQETFLRAYKSMRQYDRQRAFSTWLLSIAAHHCIDQIRRRRLHILSYDESPELDPPDLEPGPEAALLLSENQKKVQAILAGLNPQDRAAVVMRYWYEFSYEEIADTLSMSVSAVKSRLHRARRELAQRWMDHGNGVVVLERKQHESPAF